jgi:hypothetical protein
MPPEDELRFLRRAADEIRAIAEHDPRIAKQLHDIAGELDAEAEREAEALTRRFVYSQAELLPGSPIGQMYRRLKV